MFNMRPLTIAAGAAILLLGVHAIRCELEISNLDATVAERDATIVTLKASKANLSAALAEQNREVEALEQESRDRQERAAQALRQAWEDNAGLEQKLARIRDSPRTTGDPCRDAHLLIDREFAL